MLATPVQPVWKSALPALLTVTLYGRPKLPGAARAAQVELLWVVDPVRAGARADIEAGDRLRAGHARDRQDGRCQQRPFNTHSLCSVPKRRSGSRSRRTVPPASRMHSDE